MSNGSPLLTFFGHTLTESEAVQTGTVIRFLKSNHIVMHPFDRIALQHPRDPIARLHAVTQYITDRAHRELDQLAINYAPINLPSYRVRAEWNPFLGSSQITGEWHDEAARYAQTGNLDDGPCQCDACTNTPTLNTTALAAEEGTDIRG